MLRWWVHLSCADCFFSLVALTAGHCGQCLNGMDLLCSLLQLCKQPCPHGSRCTLSVAILVRAVGQELGPALLPRSHLSVYTATGELSHQVLDTQAAQEHKGLGYCDLALGPEMLSSDQHKHKMAFYTLYLIGGQLSPSLWEAQIRRLL